jgi:Na+/melibiose symporter-like transporter
MRIRNDLYSRKSSMNTIRMLAFAAAVLITAFLFRAIAAGFTAEEQPNRAAAAAHGTAASDGPKSAADRSSP